MEQVNVTLPRGRRPFTPERLVRAVRLLAAEGFVDKGLLEAASRRHTRRGGLARTRAVEVAAALVSSRSGMTLAEVGAELTRLRHHPPQGGAAWAPSSVKALLSRARSPGLVPQPMAEASSTAGSPGDPVRTA